MSSIVTKPAVMILGAGLTGLAASIETGAPIYEATDEVGGVSGVDQVGGFAFDRGIHVLQTKNKVIEKLLDETGVQLTWRTRSAHIYSNKSFTAYPFQVNTAGLPLGLRMRCVWEYLRRARNPEPVNYQQWIYKTIGTGFGDTFLIPYSEKFWTVHPREMTFDWTGNRVPGTSMWQVLRGAVWNKRTPAGTNAVFRYPENGKGYGSIPDALARAAGTIHLNHRAARIDVERRTVQFDGQGEVPYGHLISTIPLPDLIEMIPQAPAELREAAAKLRANSIVVVNLGVGRPNLTDKHWIHFPEPDICFFRLSFPANFTESVVPPGTSSISVEVAYSKDRPIDKSTITQRVIEDLIRVGILRRDDPIVATCVYDIKYGYCIYNRERKPAVRKIKTWLLEHEITTAGRYGLWAYFWSHESILNGLNTGRAVRKRLAGQRPSVRGAQEPG